MNILLVEDNPTKQGEIMCILEKEYNHLMKIDCVSHLEKAQELISIKQYDLYILDFSIRSKDHDSSIDYGIALYDYINEKQELNKIIGYSEFDNILNKRKDIIETIPFIPYSSRDDIWKNKFKDLISEYISKNNIIIDTVYDIVVVTALDDEFKYMKEASNTNWYSNKNVEEDLFNFYTTRLVNAHGETANVVAYTMNEMGMSYASALAIKMLINFMPKYLVMTGICAGFEGKTKKGDIIIPGAIFNYQSGDIREKGDFTPLYKIKEIDQKVNKIIRIIEAEYSYGRQIRDEWSKKYPTEKVAGRDQKIHINKSFGTGSAVVKDGKILKEIQEKNVKDLIGLDMEAYSVMIAKEFADENNPVVPLVIKAVQDFANKEKDKTYRNFSSYASARYFFKLCEDKLISEINKS